MAETEMLAEQEKEEKKAKKKRLAKGAVAVVAAAGVAVGGLFSSPAALLEDEEPAPLVAYMDDDDLDEDEEEEPIEDSADEESAPSGLRARLRLRLLQLPLAVRLLVILPLWALGWGLLSLGNLLWGALFGPILGKALTWLLLLIALAAAFLLAGKTIFPDLPVKKLLNRRSLTGLALGTLALGVADALLPFFWAEYERLGGLVRALGLLLVFAGVVLAFALGEQKRRKAESARMAEPEPAPPEPPEPRPLTRREILAIADSAKEQ